MLIFGFAANSGSNEFNSDRSDEKIARNEALKWEPEGGNPLTGPTGKADLLGASQRSTSFLGSLRMKRGADPTSQSLSEAPGVPEVPEEDDDHHQDLLSKELLHIRPWPSEDLLLWR